MKKLLIILFCFLSVQSFAQTDTALGMNGHKIPIKSLSLLHPLFNPNDSTAAFDSSRYYLSTFAYNGTNDSLVITFLDGTRLAVAKPSGGGAGSGWKTVNTNDMTDTLSGNVAIGNGLSKPLAKLQISNSGMGVASADSSKGILLTPTDTATSGNQKWSPPITWQASQYLPTPTRAAPFTIQAQLKSVQNNASSGYLSFRVKQDYKTSLFTEDVLTIGINNTTGGTAVGINTTPSSTGGAALNIGGTVNQISGNYSVASTWNINQSGSPFLDFGASANTLLRLNYGAIYKGTITDKPVAVGRNDSTDLGAQLSVTSTGRGFLFPRMTTTQRDSINLQITGINIVNGGTGYTVGPFLAPSAGPVPTNATTSVTSTIVWIISGGVITGYSGYSHTGGSYNNTPTFTITGGNGTGFAATPIMTQFLTPGMTIYNTTVNKIQTWDGSTWQNAW